MITLKQWLEYVDYRITEGSEYQWACFGPDAHILDSQQSDRAHSLVLFDRKTQVVYQAEVHDYEKRRSYRITNPAYLQAFKDESKQRDVGMQYAYDEVEFTDLEDTDDFAEKCVAIMNGTEYDTRVTVPLNLSKDEIMRLALEAHRRDITMNQLMGQLLTEFVQRGKPE